MSDTLVCYFVFSVSGVRHNENITMTASFKVHVQDCDCGYFLNKLSATVR